MLSRYAPSSPTPYQICAIIPGEYYTDVLVAVIARVAVGVLVGVAVPWVGLCNNIRWNRLSLVRVSG